MNLYQATSNSCPSYYTKSWLHNLLAIFEVLRSNTTTSCNDAMIMMIFLSLFWMLSPSSASSRHIWTRVTQGEMVLSHVDAAQRPIADHPRLGTKPTMSARRTRETRLTISRADPTTRHALHCYASSAVSHIGSANVRPQLPTKSGNCMRKKGMEGTRIPMARNVTVLIRQFPP